MFQNFFAACWRLTNHDLRVLRRHCELPERALRRTRQWPPVFCAEEPLVARTNELFARGIKEHRARKMGATLIKGREFVFGEANQNAGVVLRWITE